ncbi:hypothetical protein [Zooshikella ganghwensis]|uniref:hypothetical protein n=1 Tax=Zooshikella ganghwensis TaxID=202772 RepID=UPI0003F7E182|nr:hypothetical protein [Zooshikella ganghwensis]
MKLSYNWLVALSVGALLGANAYAQELNPSSLSVENNSITRWAGVYKTTTEWWEGTYSPLKVFYNGQIELAGTLITPEYDASTNTVSFNWIKVKDHKVRAKFSFSEDSSGLPLLSGTINPRAQDGPVGFEGKRIALVPEITAFVGTYETDATWWGGYFSPLKVNYDGTISIAGRLITPSYDASSKTVSFEKTQIKDTIAKGKMTFSTSGFTGTINPRAQDGPVEFTGQKVNN